MESSVAKPTIDKAECPEPQSTAGGSVSEPSVSQSKSRPPASNLFIRIEDLVNCQSVEKQRLEFKASWNKGPTKFQIVKTVSAFANDIYNDNGGYIVIGVAEDESNDADGQLELPPVGIAASGIERVQKEILGACKSLISPSYTPILSPEILDGKHVLVIWAQASENRPHRARESAKGEFHYFIRKGPETTKASEEEIRTLLQSSQKIPFDDRMARRESGYPVHQNNIVDSLVKAFLSDIGSKLETGEDPYTLHKLNLIVPYSEEAKDGHLEPVYAARNVALLMFNNLPHEYFPGAKIEVSQFTRENEVIIDSEKEFTGPLPNQIKECMKHIFSATNKEKSVGLVTYPNKALRECIVNAVYHRGYEREYNSPIKIYIRPHCLEIISYPGPHPSLKPEEFTKESSVPPIQARNRRIGEFLRDLNLAEARGTGVQAIFRTMEKNDNPDPEFDFDASYFRVTLPAHPKFQTAMLMKDVEELEASGNLSEAGEVLQKAFDKDPSIINQRLIQKFILLLNGNTENPLVKKYGAYIEKNTKARCVLLQKLSTWLEDKKLAKSSNIHYGISLIKQLIKVEADADDLSVVTDFVIELYSERTVDMRKPILESTQAAHQLLSAYGQSLLSENGKLAFHFACVKYQIYTIMTRKKEKREIIKNSGLLRYLKDARDLLENAINMSSEDEDPKFYAEQQRQLGYIFGHLVRFRRATKSDYQACFQLALVADPRIHIKQYF